MQQNKELRDVIYVGQYGYRNPNTIAIAIVFCTLGIVMLYVSIVDLLIGIGLPPLRDGNRALGLVERCLLALFFVPGGVMSLYFSNRLIQAFLLKVESKVVLDLSGVTHGEETFSWHDITWIGGQRNVVNPMRYTLVIKIPGMLPVALPTHPSLSHRDLDQIFRKISEYVVPEYHDLSVGGLMPWISKVRRPAIPIRIRQK